MQVFKRLYNFIVSAKLIQKPISLLLNMKRGYKRLFVISIDAALCVLTVWIAYYLRLGYFVPLKGLALYVAATSVALAIPIFYLFGLYRTVFRYFGTSALALLIKAMVVYGVLFAAIFTVFSFTGIPRTIGLIQPVLLILMLSISRTLVRLWLSFESTLGIAKGNSNIRKVMIYGTDETGRQLASSISEDSMIKLCGFLDEDPTLHKQAINGCSVYDPAEILSLVSRFQLTDVLVALPSVSRARRNAIINRIRGANVAVRAVPNLSDLARGTIKVSEFRELDIEDLLGREPVAPDPNLFSRNISGKIVMVTGAGGSIGSELCRQIIQSKPKSLLLLEVSEYGLYAIHSEILTILEEATEADTNAVPDTEPAVEIIPLIASICDKSRMRQIMETWRIDTIYHAAAYKHVPLVEHNLEEGIKNNLFGTLVIAQLAGENGVSNFVLVSTDKAVRPTNVMGASKRLTEIMIQALAFRNRESIEVGTNYSMVRFGNVLNSSGSVVPRFKQQIREGGPVTLTHRDITRYFMTIREAAQLVIQAGALAEGGDVFLLDMGRPVKIIDLATKMIELFGLTVRNETFEEGDIEIAIIGLRPGEKLYEELLIADDAQETLHPRIMRANEDFIPWETLETQLTALWVIFNTNQIDLVHSMMKELVKEYEPTTGIVDWVYLANNARDIGVVHSGTKLEKSV